MAFLALTLAGCASAKFLDVRHERIVSMPMHQFKEDCGTQTHLHFNPHGPAFLQNVPGAGVDKFTPFKTVLKDGFLDVDCVKDYMYYHGDKFGDNRHDYELGPVSNVSIVHYDAHVKKEDRVEMTQNVCFEFCRTVPNMGYFGVVNGRGCYCTPYFTAMASDSTECDAVCDGENTLMCGGKSKSSIFAMHMCDSTKDDLSARSGKADGLKSSMDKKVKFAKGLSTDMQRMGAALQKAFGAVGDSSATGLMQDAKVFAGTLVHKAKDVGAVADKLGDLVKAANALTGNDPATVTKAERIMEDIDETVASGEDITDQLDDRTSDANRWMTSDGSTAGAAKQYRQVMYFVDKEFDGVPTTCSGDKVAEPIFGLSQDECASACDSYVHSCVGFQYFLDPSSSPIIVSDSSPHSQMCFLFSKFSAGSYYTGCGKNWPSADASCFAKLSKFEGTTLKPNPSGKCSQCFRELTKADRCY